MYPELGDGFIAQIDGSIDYHETLIEHFREREKEPEIAVSVDMLDTGIDVPEILNLVFFKVVRSYSKFWQMIGRGTRPCRDLAGPGKDKDHFTIFDYGGNFAFFSVEGRKLDAGKPVKSLTERIYLLKARIYLLLYRSDGEEEKDLCAKLLSGLRGAVTCLDDKAFHVVQNRASVEKFRRRETWENLTAQDLVEIEQHIAPILPGEGDDIAARFFDLRMLAILFALLEEKDIEGEAAPVMEAAHRLLTPTKQSLPAVRARRETLERVAEPAFWQQATAGEVERVLWEELGTKASYHEAFGSTPIGRLVRCTVGMDRAALEQEFSQFLRENRLNLAQIDFVRRIIGYLAANGEFDRRIISEAPAFKGASNVAKLFAKDVATAKEIMEKAEAVSRNGQEIA